MTSKHLDRLSILIHGDTGRARQRQAAAMQGFGVHDISHSSRLATFTQLVAARAYDIIFINPESLAGLHEAVAVARDRSVSATPYAVVFAFFTLPSKETVKRAIHLGVDGVSSTNFTAEVLWKQIAHFTNNSRTFMRTGSYFGPDRRRTKTIHYGGVERREQAPRRGVRDTAEDHYVTSF